MGQRSGRLRGRKATFAVGNVDSTPDDEIVALYDDGANTARLLVLGIGATWGTAAWWGSGAGQYAAPKSTVYTGDFDGDGRADVGTMLDLGNGIRRLDTFSSTGTAITAPVSRWQGFIGMTTPTVVVEAGRKYRIQPTHSGKCLDLPGNSVDNRAVIDQWDCAPTATWEQFTLVRTGASPYVQIRTAAGKCFDTEAWASPIAPGSSNGPAAPPPRPTSSICWSTCPAQART